MKKKIIVIATFLLLVIAVFIVVYCYNPRSYEDITKTVEGETERIFVKATVYDYEKGLVTQYSSADMTNSDQIISDIQNILKSTSYRKDIRDYFPGREHYTSLEYGAIQVFIGTESHSCIISCGRGDVIGILYSDSTLFQNTIYRPVDKKLYDTMMAYVLANVDSETDTFGPGTMAP